ncbi:MAG TPA: hypothetical protein VFS13_08445 [Steroidobacteraceae bacterium]|jgi:hypothetical protein|nr:hypothetical protein [Steroidobacteraceae bacterium]
MTTQTTDTAKAGMTAVIAVIYLFYGTALLVAIALGGSIQGIALEWIDARLPLLILFAAVGILRRASWGRLLGYLVSLPLLGGVPIGTMLCGFMIWQLTKYRAAFVKAC